MPIYEYKCQKCGIFEITQRITDKSLGKCPTCKGKVKKLISNTSFQLKGTGWYITDYARKGKDGGGGKWPPRYLDETDLSGNACGHEARLLPFVSEAERRALQRGEAGR